MLEVLVYQNENFGLSNKAKIINLTIVREWHGRNRFLDNFLWEKSFTISILDFQITVFSGIV